MSVSGFFPKDSLLPSYNPGQNILGLLRKLGVKRHFVYSYSKLGDVVMRAYFYCPPSPQAVLIVLKQNLNA